MSKWKLALADQFGTVFSVLDKIESMDLAIAVGQKGAWTLVLPDDVDERLLRPDARVEFWYGSFLVAVGFIRRWQITDKQGARRIRLSGCDQNGLLDRRIVAYYAGSAETDKSAPADDMMKALVRENLGSLSTDPDRDLSAAGLSVQGDLSAGPIIDRGVAWRNVASALEDISAAAESEGTPVYYSIVPTSATTFEFCTWIDQPGLDRTTSGANPLLVGTAYGNLDNASLDVDYESAASFIYACGQGTEDERTVVEVYDPGAITASPFGRAERLADARNSRTVLQVEATGRSALIDAQVRQRFTGLLLDVPGCRLGIDWNLGDRVTAEFAGQEFDCLIGAVTARIASSGSSISAHLEREVARPGGVVVVYWPGGS